MKQPSVFRTLKAACLVCSALTSVAAQAQSAPQTPPAPTASSPSSADTANVDDDAEIVVNGTRQSLEDALATKRRSSEIIDSISSEGIGRLPDLNLAESLQRIPGVQINRNAPQRLGTVSLRGLPGEFAQTLINGEYLASPDVSNFSFGIVRSEVFSGIDVSKTQSAASMTGGLSGLVNLRTGDPMNAKDSLIVSANGSYEESTDKWVPGGAIAFSRQIIPGELAIRAAFGYKANNFRTDNVQINTYDVTTGAATPDRSDDVYVPRQIRLPFQTTEGRSISASFGAEWRPTDTLSWQVFGFYNNFTADAYESQFLVESLAGSRRTTIGDPTNEGPFGRTFSQVRIENPNLIVDTRNLDDAYDTIAITNKLRWTTDNWGVTGTAHYTSAGRDRFFTGWQATQAPRTGAGATNGFVATINTGAGNIGNFAFDLTPSARQLVNFDQPFGAPPPPLLRQIFATNTPGASLTALGRDVFEEDEELTLRMDVERKFEDFIINSVVVGGTYRDKRQSQRQSLMTILGTRLANLTNAIYTNPELPKGDAFFGGALGGFDPGDYGEIDVRRLNAILKPVDLAAAMARVNATNPTQANLYFLNENGFINHFDAASIAATYVNNQTIYGGYLQANFDQSLSSSLQLRGNFGVRYEHSSRSTVSGLGGTAPIDFEYDNWLPLANVILEIGDRLLVRTSYTETLRRPQVEGFAVRQSVAVRDNGNTVTADFGAADLRPFRSQNLDASIEFYNRGGSSVSVAGFYKRVIDFASATRPCPADGGGLGFGPLVSVGGVCRTAQATPASGTQLEVNQGATVNFNITANQDTFKLYGFEVSVQQNLDFLPAPWNGFGGQVNYTNVQFDSMSTFRLSELSEHTVNLILYYETQRFGIRAAYNWRSEYFLASGGSVTGADRIVDARPQLDMSATLNVTPRFAFTFEAFNVTNANLYEFEGERTRARNYIHYGRTLSVGAVLRF